MKKFIFSNILWGVILTLVTLFFYVTQTGLETLELKFYDFRSRISAKEIMGQEIAIIQIDEESISKIGRWPWPRSKIAEMITWLSTDTARPSVIGLNILFSEPEKNEGMKVADLIKGKYSQLIADKKIKETTKESEFLKTLDELKQEIDNDLKLARSIENASNVVLPMFFHTGAVLSKPKEFPNELKKFSLSVSHAITLEDGQIAEGSDWTAPIDIFFSSSSGVGHVNVFSDTDGTVRKEYPFVLYGENFYPSFAIELLRNHLRLKTSDITVSPGKNIVIGKNNVPLDSYSRILVSFNDSKSVFKYYSFYDVLNGKVVPEAFKDKIVLIGPTAQGIGSFYVTPMENNMSAVEFTANVIENILHNRFITRAANAFYIEPGLILLTGIFITLVLPRLKAALAAIITLLMFAAIIGTGIFLFTSKGEWLKITHPSFLLVIGYLFIVTKKFFTTEKKKELIEVSAIETNKMLGLSFQGQGMLDLAFEKFRMCPLDNTMKDLLYNLGLDFERKRQFNKAVAVYEHIATTDSKYKDIQQKIEVLRKASEGAVFGGAIGKTQESTILIQGSSTTPTLGRYEVLKELGKGAMGIVYLGKDPKINRTVAIKTMRFEEGIDEKTLKELKDRFFREAQAAGNLSHPNIVKIFDAGEEQDIAYIAMELLKGEDLKKWTAKDNLLPVDKVLEYIALSAEALDYAHKNGVVHRDIKPANIMLLEDGTLRVTDFGIARLQSSSKTATGTVLGTPYYMSPEQIAGKKVDGRSDIFSLGVTLYELLTGEKPWKGGESIGTLFFQITQEPYPDPLSIRPDLPKDVIKVIDKSLKKNPDERYQTAGEIARDLRNILSKKSILHEPPQIKPQPDISKSNELPPKVQKIEAPLVQTPKIAKPPLSDTPSESHSYGKPQPESSKVPNQIQPIDLKPQVELKPAVNHENIPPKGHQPGVKLQTEPEKLQPTDAIKPLQTPVSQSPAVPTQGKIELAPKEGLILSAQKEQKSESDVKITHPQDETQSPAQVTEKKQESGPVSAASSTTHVVEKVNSNMVSPIQAKTDEIRPIKETLAQSKIEPPFEKKFNQGSDFEKTLPLIYPDEEEKKK